MTVYCIAIQLWYNQSAIHHNTKRKNKVYSESNVVKDRHLTILQYFFADFKQNIKSTNHYFSSYEYKLQINGHLCLETVQTLLKCM